MTVRACAPGGRVAVGLDRGRRMCRGGMDSGGMGEGFGRTLVVSNEPFIHVGS